MCGHVCILEISPCLSQPDNSRAGGQRIKGRLAKDTLGHNFFFLCSNKSRKLFIIRSSYFPSHQGKICFFVFAGINICSFEVWYGQLKDNSCFFFLIYPFKSFFRSPCLIQWINFFFFFLHPSFTWVLLMTHEPTRLPLLTLICFCHAKENPWNDRGHCVLWRVCYWNLHVAVRWKVCRQYAFVPL